MTKIAQMTEQRILLGHEINYLHSLQLYYTGHYTDHYTGRYTDPLHSLLHTGGSVLRV